MLIYSKQSTLSLVLMKEWSTTIGSTVTTTATTSTSSITSTKTCHEEKFT